jgi:hypothetical protein
MFPIYDDTTQDYGVVALLQMNRRVQKFSSNIERFILVGEIRGVFTSMFIHGGIFHIVGNMIFYSVGDNIDLQTYEYLRPQIFIIPFLVYFANTLRGNQEGWHIGTYRWIHSWSWNWICVEVFIREKLSIPIMHNT